MVFLVDHSKRWPANAVDAASTAIPEEWSTSIASAVTSKTRSAIAADPSEPATQPPAKASTKSWTASIKSYPTSVQASSAPRSNPSQSTTVEGDHSSEGM